MGAAKHLHHYSAWPARTVVENMSLSRLGDTFETLGWANGLLYLVARILHKLSIGKVFMVRYIFFAQPVPDAGHRGPHDQVIRGVRQVDANDPIVRDFPRPAPVITRRFEAGATCFVAESRDRFSGFLWFQRNAYEEDEVRCRYELYPPERCVWDYDVYVEPEFRMGRTFSRLWQAANAHLAEKKVEWSISRISAFNPNSLAAHRRMGIRALTTATFIVIGSLQISLLGRSPFIHFGASARTRPVLKLSPPDTCTLST